MNEKLLAEFTEAMKALYGERLVSLNLYGEAAVDEGGHDRRPVKLLAVLKEVEPPELKKYRDVYPSWLKKGIHPPLMLTERTLSSSTDVFPIEFYEMKEAYRLLHGKDVLAGLVISDENLRRQCEEQIKGKFIHLRQAYIETDGDKDALARLIAASVEPFTEVMRNLLRIMEKGVHVRKDSIIKEFCSHAGISAGPFMEALALRREGKTPPKDVLEGLYARYLSEVSRMADFVDKMKF